MLVLRKAQIKAISYLAREDFADRLLAHVSSHFSSQTEAMGASELRAAVEEGIHKAEAHGLESERDIIRYLNLMFTFGRHFDRDPTLGWATRLFARKGRLSPPRMMNRLYAQGLRHEAEGQGYNPGQA